MSGISRDSVVADQARMAVDDEQPRVARPADQAAQIAAGLADLRNVGEHPRLVGRPGLRAGSRQAEQGQRRGRRNTHRLAPGRLRGQAWNRTKWSVRDLAEAPEPFASVNGAGHSAGSELRPAASAAKSSGLIQVRLRDRGQQRLGIGVLRVGEQLLGRGELDHAAGAHHADALGDVFHHREIVGDEQIGQPQLLCRSLSRFRICACTETSSAETGSSQISSSGSSASARAIPIRWRWPPEKLCG